MSKDERYSCKKCSIEIGGHNKFLHDGMCDDCYFNEYFPDETVIVETDHEAIKSHCKNKEVLKQNQLFSEFITSSFFDPDRFQKIVNEVTSKLRCADHDDCCSGYISLLTNEMNESWKSFFSSVNKCPLAFNILESAKEEFLEALFEFETNKTDNQYTDKN
jgi:hypothetical protein